MRLGGSARARQFGFSAPITVTDVSEGPPELFPDPTLADTGNGALWAYGGGAMGAANGGAGPDIFANEANGENDDCAELQGAHETAMLAAWGVSETKTVQLTVTSMTAPGSLVIRARLGDPVTFAFVANGSVSHSVLSGENAGAPFRVCGPSGSDGGIFTLSAISVT